MSGKKILYTASTFGHLQSFHLPYLRWFAEQGCEVTAAAGGSPRPLDGVSRFVELPFEKSMASPSNFRAMRQLSQMLREERYDLVSTHTSLAAFFTRMAVRRAGKGQTAIVNTAHGYLFDEATPLLKRTVLLGAERLCAPVTDWVLTMNRQDMRFAQKYKLGANVLETPGMGVDLSRFVPVDEIKRQNAQRRWDIPVGSVVMVYAAEFSARKNQRFLIELLQKLPKAIYLLLPGSGAALEECRTLAREIGVASHVRLPGFVPDIQDCYAAADLCISASRIEGLPFNIMEAMACGLPVVVSRIKGHEDLVTPGENGLLFPYGDTAACVKAVETLLNAGMRAEMGRAAARMVQKYRLQTVFPALTAIYARIAGLS